MFPVHPFQTALRGPGRLRRVSHERRLRGRQEPHSSCRRSTELRNWLPHGHRRDTFPTLERFADQTTTTTSKTLKGNLLPAIRGLRHHRRPINWAAYRFPRGVLPRHRVPLLVQRQRYGPHQDVCVSGLRLRHAHGGVQLPSKRSRSPAGTSTNGDYIQQLLYDSILEMDGAARRA